MTGWQEVIEVLKQAQERYHYDCWCSEDGASAPRRAAHNLGLIIWHYVGPGRWQDALTQTGHQVLSAWEAQQPKPAPEPAAPAPVKCSCGRWKWDSTFKRWHITSQVCLTVSITHRCPVCGDWLSDDGTVTHPRTKTTVGKP